MLKRAAYDENNESAFYFPHKGSKGETGISGEQGIPGPPVCTNLLYSHLAMLEMCFIFVTFKIMICDHRKSRDSVFLTFTCFQGSNWSEGLSRNDGPQRRSSEYLYHTENFFVLVLILTRAPRRHSQTCPHYTNIINYRQWGHMEMMLTQISPPF